MFLIDIRYTAEMNIINQYVMDHRTWLDEKYKNGLLLCSGPKEPRTGGIIIALCNEYSQVDDLIKEDPYYKNNVAQYTITKFLPNKYHTQIKDLVI